MDFYLLQPCRRLTELTLHADGTILFLWQGTSMSGPVILGISDGTGVGQDLQVLWPLC